MPRDSGSQVRAFWEHRAKQVDVSTPEVTHRDVWQRWLEIETIKKLLRKEDRTLDVGCGNGYATKVFAPFVKEIVGIDYSEAMISRAKEEKVPHGYSNTGTCTSTPTPTFKLLDVLELSPSKMGLFDAVISVRCLINLCSWVEQQHAISNIASVLAPGGRFIFIEGCEQGRSNLNRLRRAVSLPEMPGVWHNIDFHREKTVEFLKTLFAIRQELHFGTYDFISRIVHPLLVAPGEPNYQSRINEVAARLALQLQEFGEISRILFFVLERQ